MEVLFSTEIVVDKHSVRFGVFCFFFKSREICLHLDPVLRIRIMLIWIRIRIRPFT
jgi:hypothetical protein